MLFANSCRCSVGGKPSDYPVKVREFDTQHLFFFPFFFVLFFFRNFFEVAAPLSGSRRHTPRELEGL